jgi:outer membrane receptor for monomeric catechols
MHPRTELSPSQCQLRAPATDATSVFRRSPAVAAAAFLLAFGPAGGVGQAARSEPAEDQNPVALDKFEVRGERIGDKRYNASSSLTATKTDTPLVNVPQSLTVVTREQMQDQHMTNMGDVVRYVPGVGTHQGEGNRDQIIFRGNSSSADFFVNGVRDDVQYYRDVYNLDRIEVLRGPNAMIFGRGGGGGIINRSTKEAGFTESWEFSVAGGSYEQARLTLDVNQPLSKQAAVRLNGLLEDSGSFRHGVGRGHRARGCSWSPGSRPCGEPALVSAHHIAAAVPFQRQSGAPPWGCDPLGHKPPLQGWANEIGTASPSAIRSTVS